MTPEEQALRSQVDAIYSDERWLDEVLAAFDARDGGNPGDEPDHEFIAAMDRYEMTPEGAQALLDRFDPPQPRKATLYDWALDAGLDRIERQTVALRFWTLSLATAIVAGVVLKAAGAL